ncbi:hypothetical protein T4E_3670 [Trichinella pseudospiralis]|uniref:Uncharacterized protein n=1 Tax=Trichinella pseudospiralis TaxID=6337 RepID=A0A0V0XE72_TRIPS|nr:hypothetical protein T4E_4662 [Trichinella pseudospiralis]KRX86262.1 hypothetical protein T4E_3670 [Trichinella pseudospiralis]
MIISYGYRVLSFLNIMKVKGERCKRIQRPHLAWVVVAHAMLHYMPDQLAICQDNEMSSSMLMLKVIKTVIEGKQLTPNAQSCFKLPENSEKASSIHFLRGQRCIVSKMTQHCRIYLCLLCFFVHFDNILQIKSFFLFEVRSQSLQRCQKRNSSRDEKVQ